MCFNKHNKSSKTSPFLLAGKPLSNFAVGVVDFWCFVDFSASAAAMATTTTASDLVVASAAFVGSAATAIADA